MRGGDDQAGLAVRCAPHELGARPPWTLPALPPALSGSIALHAGAVATVLAAPETWPWLLGLLGLNHAVLGAAGMVPRSRLIGPNIDRLPAPARARGEVALTFDDGPDPIATPILLDILGRHGATATFFCVGARAARHPRLIREIAAAGHSVQNHSMRHAPGFACHGRGWIAAEIGGCQDILTALSGRTPMFFRPPMGLRNPLLEPVLQHFGLSLVSWTRRGLDGVASADPARVLRRLTHGLAAGDVLLLHDGGPSCGRAAIAVLPGLLRSLDERGLTPVSLEAAMLPMPRSAAHGVADGQTPPSPSAGYASR